MRGARFKFGTCSVLPDAIGDWAIEKFEVSEQAAKSFNVRAIISGDDFGMVKPGEYKRLVHTNPYSGAKTVVMSNTPMEVRTNYEAYLGATGRVLINGLGMGMVLEGVLSKPDVTYVRVIELNHEVIQLVEPTFRDDPRVEIVHADAYTYQPPKGEPPFDYAWHDVWNEICPDNLELMAKLTRKWRKPRTKDQGVWSRDIIRMQERRAR